MSSLVTLAPAVRRFRVLLWMGAVIATLFGCRGDPGAALVELDDSRRLAADLRVQFNKASDASDRAVMADTDEASVAFADEAKAAVHAAENDFAAIAPKVRGLGFPAEVHSLEAFEKHFTEYRNLDRNILSLAVENTNLKAQRLSFGPAKQAADTFRDSLRTMAATIAPADHCRVDQLVDRALLAVREIQVLQAPHIAESDDAVMTRMEKEMDGLEAGAREALKTLGELVPPTGRAALASAVSALDQFKAISTQIVALSRRNTNVRSLELSLRSKPALAAACDDDLRQLQEALSKEGSKATR